MHLSSRELKDFFSVVAEPTPRCRTSEDVVVSKVGRELYENFFRGYTRKQWGLDPSELDAQVTARVPTRTNRDDRYFTDAYQAMPRDGFTRMFANMLDHPNIRILLNTDYRDIKEIIPYRELIYCGPVDEFFDRVTVNTDKPELRENRLRLLSEIRATLNRVADFSQIEG